MGNTWFQFQQFKVNQDRCAMKISTDAILLGSLARANTPKTILDLGTGTGVIALMLAQRFPEALITGIEIDSDAAEQATENFRESPFSSRLSLKLGRVQDFSVEEKFDLVVSNPPFFPDHLKSIDSKRNRALHTDELSFEELLEKVVQLLHPHGYFWVILPPRQMDELVKLALRAQLFENQKIRVRDKQESKVLREVSGFSFRENPPNVSELYLKENDGKYSVDYRGVLGGFLLGY